MPNPIFIEKRSSPRFQINIPLICSEPDLRKEFHALTRDISAQGLCAVLDRDLLPDTFLDINIQMLDNDEQIYRRGRVVWSKRINSNYKIGIKLEEPKLNSTMLVLRTINYRIKYQSHLFSY
jgi:hypothetical protein